ncbi:hypothetical protein BGZ82_004983 [Podila clonocystis]|nr:hypothetical protein BGZ82_004983 [Podila clonocystis]
MSMQDQGLDGLATLIDVCPNLQAVSIVNLIDEDNPEMDLFTPLLQLLGLYPAITNLTLKARTNAGKKIV